MIALCWFRRDLRLDDNPAWSAATRHHTVVPVFVLEPALLDRCEPLRRAALLANVAALRTELRSNGGDLTLLAGPATTAIPAFAARVGAEAVHANDDVSPFSGQRDAAVAEGLDAPLHLHWGVLVHEPGSVLTGKGTLSQVFTPFWKRWIDTPIIHTDHPGSAKIAAHASEVDLPEVAAPFPPGSDGAHERLARFLDVVDDYPNLRDAPATPGTSQLSADLHFGTIGPREVIDIVGLETAGREAFIRQLAWRDWYGHLLRATPSMVNQAIKPAYDKIRWRNDPAEIDAWKHGQTGYPLVDAGMRQLLATGWMHNRVRMVAGSFLVKHLLVDWRIGERWFRRHLTDGDLAQNAGNWQWVAGTGPDAAPYFRIFNPIAQSAKFDPQGAYIRTWVPELAALDAEHVHVPWEVAPLDLAVAGVVLGDTYPSPIVDHREARERCLAAYKSALG